MYIINLDTYSSIHPYIQNFFIYFMVSLEPLA